MEEAIEPATAFDGKAHGPLGHAWIDGVAADDRDLCPERPGRLDQVLVVAADHRQPCALAKTRRRGGKSEAAGPAHDHDRASLEARCRHGR